jgi:hypothetical protein
MYMGLGVSETPLGRVEMNWMEILEEDSPHSLAFRS